MLNRLADFNFGNKWTLLPVQDSSGIFKEPWWVASMVSPPGNVTVGPKMVLLRSDSGASVLK